jgi:hypothetical protein
MAHRLIAQSFLRYPLSTFLGNEGQIRALRELSRHGGDLFVTELSNRTALAPQGVRNILATLIASGGVRTVETGRSRLLRIGDHPLIPTVRELLAAEEATYTDVMDCLRASVNAHQGVPATWSTAALPEVRTGRAAKSTLRSWLTMPRWRRYKEGQALPRERPLSTPRACSIVGLGTSDVITLSARYPSWAGLPRHYDAQGRCSLRLRQGVRQAHPRTTAKTLREALDEIEFVPTYGARRIIVREGHPQELFTRWRKPKERD